LKGKFLHHRSPGATVTVAVSSGTASVTHHVNGPINEINLLRPGYGGIPVDTTATLEDVAETMYRALVEAIGQGNTVDGLVGWSGGAPTAAIIYANHPEMFTGPLILYAPSAPIAAADGQPVSSWKLAAQARGLGLTGNWSGLKKFAFSQWLLFRLLPAWLLAWIFAGNFRKANNGVSDANFLRSPAGVRVMAGMKELQGWSRGRGIANDYRMLYAPEGQRAYIAALETIAEQHRKVVIVEGRMDPVLQGHSAAIVRYLRQRNGNVEHRPARGGHMVIFEDDIVDQLVGRTHLFCSI
jgi:pimeloyl-ACP methyl ester carboxylesterase